MNGARWTAPVFFGLVLALFLIGAGLFGRVLAEDGWTASECVLFSVFAALFSYLAFGFAHAMIGACLRWSDRRRLPPVVPPATPGEPGRTAILMPVYNEPVERVFGGLKATFASIQKHEDGHCFDLHILSDSNRSSSWLAEERAWLDWVRSEKLEGRVFYRHRSQNLGKKAGNIADFCRARGGDYDFMVVLDADSVMTGETIAELRRRMMANSKLALIQTMPRLVGGRSLYGRLQQFGNRLYGPLFMDGLAFWQQGGGNFWGHNAIIRIVPFMDECGLPELPGPEPFGGPILSHDFVEAGLLVAAGWEVRLAPELEGSYEEGPQSIVDAATRDRRWCQGNLQHSVLLGARGMRWQTRLHFINGIMGYLSSPLWLMLVVLGVIVLSGTGTAEVGSTGQLLTLTALLLFLPKAMCVFDLLFDRKRRESFGGLFKASAGALLETLFSALIAPINMAFHSHFVLWNLLGKKVAWEAQHRGAEGTRWKDAWSTHGWHAALGVVLGVLSWHVGGPGAALLASPVIAGLVFSPVISVATSHRQPWFDRMFLTPEEFEMPPEVASALDVGEERHGIRDDFEMLIADPIWNATHLALLQPGGGQSTPEMESYLLQAGPGALTEMERMAILGDPSSLGRLHLELWRRPSEQLHEDWQKMLERLMATGDAEAV